MNLQQNKRSDTELASIRDDFFFKLYLRIYLYIICASWNINSGSLIQQ